MSYTDPTGYSFKSFFKKYWRVIAAAVIIYMTAGAATPWVASWGAAFGTAATATTAATLTVAGSAVVGAMTGAIGGAILTGTLKGAFYGALSGAALGAIGASGLNQFGKTVAGGAANGVTTELQGGKFGHGFLSAGAGFWSGLKFGGSPSFGKFMGTAIAGGTISELTGGKFANGAISAGLAYILAAKGSEADEIQAAGSGKTPTGVSNDVTTDARLGLTVKGNTLTGDIFVGCSNVLATMCSQSITEFQGINGTDGTYTVALNIRAAAVGETPSFELYGGGIHPKYNGWFSKQHRIFGRNYGREIHLFRSNAGYTSETAVHEFGHFLGLAHQANSTRSFMSYATNRYAVPVSSDFQRLVVGYR